jgi:polyhydroxyalkanoate synthesis regulator phasin
MGNLRKLKDLVQELVDKGATTVEEVHKSIAALPLEVLENIEGVGEKAGEIKEIQQKTIGNVYNIIRDINNRAADLAEDIISKVEKDEEDE